MFRPNAYANAHGCRGADVSFAVARGEGRAPPFAVTAPGPHGIRKRMVSPGAPHGRTVLVVGATGLLGAAISHALQARGDRVVLTARDPNKLAALSAELGKGGAPPPPFVTADLSHPDAVDRIVEGLKSRVDG